MPNSKDRNARKRPCNALSREERIERWGSIASEGAQHRPWRLTGDDRARFIWLNMIARSSLPALTRLVAHTLALHGNNRGERVFPSVQVLSAEAGVSGRSTCTHTETLVRSGWLQRERKGRGFVYHFSVPQALFFATENEALTVAPWDRDPSWQPTVEADSTIPSTAEAPSTVGPHETHRAPTVARPADTVEAGALTVERRTGTVERDDKQSLNAVQSRFPSEVPILGSHSEVLIEGADALSAKRFKGFERNIDPQEQLRKALKHLEADPSADVCRYYGVSMEAVRQARKMA